MLSSVEDEKSFETPGPVLDHFHCQPSSFESDSQGFSVSH